MGRWLALAALMAAVAVAAPAPGLLLVAFVTVGYGTVTRLWTHFGVRRVTYERRLSSDRAVAGDSLTLDVSIWNRKPLPLPWVAADDLVTDGLEIRERPVMDRDNELLMRRVMHNAWALAWYERVVRHFHLDAVSRGVYDFGPVRIQVRDILGRDAADEEHELPARLVVSPRTLPVRRAETGAAPMGDRRARSSLFADPALYGGVRPFQAGDPLRQVHWRATARLGSVVSRRYEPARGQQVVLAVDIQTVDGPQGQVYWDEDAFEALCVAAASLSRRLLDDGASVGVAAPSFTGTPQRLAWLPPRASAGQMGAVGALLARIGPVSSGAFEGLLTWLTRSVPPGTTVMVLTARSPARYLPVLRRLALSGYAVELITLGADGAEHASMARRSGFAAAAARLGAHRADAGWREADALLVGV